MESFAPDIAAGAQGARRHHLYPPPCGRGSSVRAVGCKVVLTATSRSRNPPPQAGASTHCLWPARRPLSNRPGPFSPQFPFTLPWGSCRRIIGRRGPDRLHWPLAGSRPLWPPAKPRRIRDLALARPVPRGLEAETPEVLPAVSTPGSISACSAAARRPARALRALLHLHGPLPCRRLAALVFIEPLSEAATLGTRRPDR